MPVLNLKHLFVFLILISASTLAYSSPVFKHDEIKSIISQCTPPGYHEIIFKIVQKESSNRVFAIQINGARLHAQPKTREEAINLIRMLELSDYSFDIGLGQINSQHFLPGRVFSELGYRAEDALDPCTSVRMSAYILDEAYSRTGSLVKALSIYNTGSTVNGLKNGYVASVLNTPLP